MRKLCKFDNNGPRDPPLRSVSTTRVHGPSSKNAPVNSGSGNRALGVIISVNSKSSRFRGRKLTHTPKPNQKLAGKTIVPHPCRISPWSVQRIAPAGRKTKNGLWIFSKNNTGRASHITKVYFIQLLYFLKLNTFMPSLKMPKICQKSVGMWKFSYRRLIEEFAFKNWKR